MDMALKKKDFRALDGYLTKENATYVRDTIFTEDWIKKFVMPSPDHYYSKDIRPMVTIHGTKIVIQNGKKHHQKFVWSFDVSKRYDLTQQTWSGEEDGNICFKKCDQQGNSITWNKKIYYLRKGKYSWGEKVYRTKYQMYGNKVNDYDSETGKNYYIFSTRGIIGAHWVGTKKRGLVQISISLCNLSQKLQKMEIASSSSVQSRRPLVIAPTLINKPTL